MYVVGGDKKDNVSQGIQANGMPESEKGSEFFGNKKLKISI